MGWMWWLVESSGFACRCDSRTREEAFASADAVFLGRVVEGTSAASHGASTTRPVTLEVHAAWKGLAPDQTRVRIQARSRAHPGRRDPNPACDDPLRPHLGYPGRADLLWPGPRKPGLVYRWSGLWNSAWRRGAEWWSCDLWSVEWRSGGAHREIEVILYIETS